MHLVITICLLVSAVGGTPNGNLNISELIDQMKEIEQIFTAEFDIALIVHPMNALNNLHRIFDSDRPSNISVSTQTIFFVLADNNGGNKTNKGLYVRKNGEVIKLLDNGVDVAADHSYTKEVYFAASDGIYSYNAKENKAEKYGTLTDNIISMAKCNGSDIFYILTKDHIVYKVTEGGTKKEAISEIDNAQQIVADHRNNIYYTTRNNIYIYSRNGVKKIENIPEKWDNIILLKPAWFFTEGIAFIIDNKMYLPNLDARSTVTITYIGIRATAYTIESMYIHYFGYNKKIYGYYHLPAKYSSLSTSFHISD